VIIHGTITKTLPSGEKAECSYMIDLAKGELVQIGGEADIVAEDIDLIMDMISTGKEIFGEEEGQ
jgi:hypothetical protein